MTSKRLLKEELSNITKSRDDAWNRIDILHKAEYERDAFKNENDILIREIHAHADDNKAIVQFVDDLFLIEPQLKHTLTNGVWDFERVHRAAEALRAEDALASVGYTDQCVEWPENVTPLFPHRPDGEVA